MLTRLEIYEEISGLSSKMADAARANDWEVVTGIERRIAQLRDSLISDSGTDRDAVLNLANIDRTRALIEKILEDDAEVRRHVEPWMAHVRQFLGGQSRRRQVEAAYSASDGRPGFGVSSGSRA